MLGFLKARTPGFVTRKPSDSSDCVQFQAVRKSWSCPGTSGGSSEMSWLSVQQASRAPPGVNITGSRAKPRSGKSTRRASSFVQCFCCDLLCGRQLHLPDGNQSGRRKQLHGATKAKQDIAVQHLQVFKEFCLIPLRRKIPGASQTAEGPCRLKRHGQFLKSIGRPTHAGRVVFKRESLRPCYL